MKRDRIKTLLLAEALICALLALALWLFEGDAFSVAGFPGSAVGQGLSALAASGRFGFALAFTLYAAVILLPLYALVHIGARRELKPEDALLVLIAFAAACALFPHGWTAYWSTSAEALFPRLAWQWLIFALLAGWVVLRLLRRFSGGDTQELLKLFRALLILAAAYFVFEVCFAEFAGLFSAIDALKAGNTAFTADTVLPVATDITGSKSLVFSYVVLALRFAAEVLPTLLAAATAYFAIGLLDTMEDGAFTQESAAYAPKLAEWCVKVLKLSVLFALAVNVLQAVCAPLILSTSISIPSACSASCASCSPRFSVRGSSPRTSPLRRTTTSLSEGAAMAITVHLDEVLKARGMTSKELCATVGITEANLSILRSGKAKGVRFATLNRICCALECNVGDILQCDGELEAEHEE